MQNHEAPDTNRAMAADGFPKSSAVFKGAWAVFRENFWKLQLFAWLPFFGGLLIGLAAGITALSSLAALGPGGFGEFVAEIAQDPVRLIMTVLLLIVAVAAVLAIVYVGTWYQLAFLKTVSNPQIGFKEAFRQTRSKIFSFLWMAALSALVILGGMGLFIVPGIYLGIVLAFAHFVLLFENEKGLAALAKSYQYVRGDVLRAVKYALFLVLVSLVVYIPVGLVAAGIASVSDRETGRIVGDVVETIFGPLVLAYGYAVYLAFREKKTASLVPMTDRQKKVFAGLAVWGIVIAVSLALTATYFVSKIDFQKIGDSPRQYQVSE